MKTNTTRRNFIKQSGLLTGSLAIASSPLLSACAKTMKATDFKISLAQWSLHKTLFAGEMDNLDFAKVAKNDFGISAVEYVSQFFKDKAKDKAYINQMKQVAEDNGVKSLLIMIDGEGELGDNDLTKRNQAVENHYKWIEAAQQLGCHSIRVNAAGDGTAEEVQQNAIEGLRSLATFAKDYDINVLVENHGGFSSNGKWLNKVISTVDMNNCGTLPDFGNFCITRDENWNCLEDYDRYQGMKDIMPFAKGVSAKSHDFDEEGNEIHSDFAKMLKIVKSAGFKGYIGVEYEGKKLSEYDGIKATKALLDKTIASL
ncbi:MAG: sugar phosphate isomerase/epimerase family protein [Reichenbachiella sp.]|uniref:sugar phosphate isomerase/epimerase family protein n=1 Tax=Reichenbachiella sp. TaxID=2184521 RepID=UPI002967185B|nr:sugar phosphate isomerase/epimerase family protein [Reichenbachiella sp.]MDW3210433.1 sugar phosphate isomerase/epimerase family protein [Reichenbachiella sp.]